MNASTIAVCVLVRGCDTRLPRHNCQYVILRRHFTSDIFDLLLFLFLCLALAFTAIQNFSRACSMWRQSLPSETSRHKPTSSLRYSIPRATVLASVVVLFLFMAVPVQNGRTMSHASLSQRNFYRKGASDSHQKYYL